MKRILSFLLLLFLVYPDIIVAGNEIRKETYVYSIKDLDTLRVDKYDMPDGQIKPCVIFVFGGGFSTGTRDDERYLPYYQFLLNEGYTVVAIDYRLGFKHAKELQLKRPKQFIVLFENAIFMATEDFLDATDYVLKNADNWDIDKNRIIASGSSAGAIIVLQGEYERANRTAFAQRLPEDFKYTGVISFAGAIYSNNGDLKWETTPAPVLMFHGDADRSVPFNKIKIFRRGFFGSEYIANKYKKHNFPYYLYIEENAGHKLATELMINNQEEIRTFLRKHVKEKKELQINTKVKNLSEPTAQKKIKMKDYVRSNF